MEDAENIMKKAEIKMDCNNISTMFMSQYIAHQKAGFTKEQSFVLIVEQLKAMYGSRPA